MVKKITLHKNGYLAKLYKADRENIWLSVPFWVILHDLEPN